MKTDKKYNVKGIGISAFLIIVSLLLIAFGIWGGELKRLPYELKKDFYPSKITANDVGKKFRFGFEDGTVDIGVENYYFTALADPDVSDDDYQAFWYGIHIVGKSTSELASLENFYFVGYLQKYDIEEEQAIKSSLEAWIRDYYTENYDLIIEYLGEETTVEQLVEDELNHFTSYYFEVTKVVVPTEFNGVPYIIVGVVLGFFAVLFELCFVFKLKKRIVIPSVMGVIGLIFLVGSGILFNHLRTAFSIKEIGPGMYTMKNYECTNTQGMIDANLQSIEDFANWAVKEHYFNIPLEIDVDNLSCAAFAATTSAGNHLFGRNFDYDTTDTVLIYSHPKGSYASIGCADMAFLDVGQEATNRANSLVGRASMIVLPYAIMDGINEAGFGVGILELTIDEIHQDKGKPDILIFTAMRALLDNCATVDEAIAFLDNYDVHSDLGNSYHLFVTDKSGTYAVIEWLDGEMIVNELPAVTNSVLTPGEHYNEGHVDDRLNVIMNALGSETNITQEGAMNILNEARWSELTQWSCVYNLEDFSVDICLDADYSMIYKFSGKDLSSQIE